MRKKFKIVYAQDHPDEKLRGTRYKPPKNKIVMMSDQGVFFLYTNEQYYPYAQPLHTVLPKYDVEWK